MINRVRRGEVYLANLGKGIGSEEQGIRPVVVVQNDLGNKHSPTIIIIPMTKRIEDKNKIPTHVRIIPFGNMKYDATIMAEQIKVLDKRRIKHYIDTLPEDYMKKINVALKIAIGLADVMENKEKTM